jgi:hypothetical protein
LDQEFAGVCRWLLNDGVDDVGDIALRIPRFLPLPSSPLLNWQKEYYPMIVESDIIGSGIRRSSQMVVE